MSLVSICLASTVGNAGFWYVCPCFTDKQALLQELAALWEGVLEAMEVGDPRRIADAALRYAYNWYNFMPLARGTAVVGYITLLALFLAAAMPITARIPKVQPCGRSCVVRQIYMPRSAAALPRWKSYRLLWVQADMSSTSTVLTLLTSYQGQEVRLRLVDCVLRPMLKVCCIMHRTSKPIGRPS